MTLLLAIDPGPEQSAWLEFNTESGRPTAFGKESNERLLGRLDNTLADELAIEMIASYGMPVGKDVFETCVWIGRFAERWIIDAISWEARQAYCARPYPAMVTRHDVKMALCHSARANDATVRQALIDRFGPGKERAVGRKASPGPLYGVTGDVWSALGVAVVVGERTASEAVA